MRIATGAGDADDGESWKRKQKLTEEMMKRTLNIHPLAWLAAKALALFIKRYEDGHDKEKP